MSESKRWENPTYFEIKEIEARDETVLFIFMNGDRVILEKHQLIPPDCVTTKWKTIRIGSDRRRFRVEAPFYFAEEQELTISSILIRQLSDPGFVKYLTIIADERVGKLGRRLQLLRQSRGLSREWVTQAARLWRNDLERLEYGLLEAPMSAVYRILAVLGFSAKDLDRQITFIDRDKNNIIKE